MVSNSRATSNPGIQAVSSWSGYPGGEHCWNPGCWQLGLSTRATGNPGIRIVGTQSKYLGDAGNPEVRISEDEHFPIVGNPESRKPGFSKILQFRSVRIDIFGFSDFRQFGFMEFRKADYSEVHISGTPKVRTFENLHARNFRNRNNYKDLGVC